MNKQFCRFVNELPRLFKELNQSKPFVEKGWKWQENKSGIYVFFKDDKAVHVGRTRNLKVRLRSHITKSHNNASFAFKLTRQCLGLKATYTPKGSRGGLMKDQEFLQVFIEKIDLVKKMEVKFLEVTDPVEQYLLELYAHLEYKLSLDEFDTH